MQNISDASLRYIYIHIYICVCIVSVTKMGNIVPRTGIEPSVLPLYHIGSLMSTLCPCPPGYVALCLRYQCKLLHTHTHIYIYMYINTYNYIYVFIYIPDLISLRCC